MIRRTRNFPRASPCCPTPVKTSLSIDFNDDNRLGLAGVLTNASRFLLRILTNPQSLQDSLLIPAALKRRPHRKPAQQVSSHMTTPSCDPKAKSTRMPTGFPLPTGRVPLIIKKPGFQARRPPTTIRSQHNEPHAMSRLCRSHHVCTADPPSFRKAPALHLH